MTSADSNAAVSLGPLLESGICFLLCAFIGSFAKQSNTSLPSACPRPEWWRHRWSERGVADLRGARDTTSIHRKSLGLAEDRHDLVPALRPGEVHSGFAVACSCAPLGTAGEQQAHGLRLAVAGGFHERRSTLEVMRIDGGSSIHEPADQVRVAGPARDHERR